MTGCVAIRRETKSPWERRTPLTPNSVRRLINEHGLEVLVQPSARRVLPDSDYVRAGATLTTNLAEARVVLGVKEIPPELLQEDTTYAFFSHVIKGQTQNMPALSRLLELKCTLIDYEMIKDEENRRLIFFGHYAGLAGMIDTLSTLGQRLLAEGQRTPLAKIQPAHAYESLEEAKAAIRLAGKTIQEQGLSEPIVIGIAGYGNVANRVREIISELPSREVEPEDLPDLAASTTTPVRRIRFTTFREEHMARPVDPSSQFELQDYYQNPERYRGIFHEHLPHLTVLVNCIYWEERYPRLVRLEDVDDLWSGGSSPRLRVIGDLGCDIGGAIQCTVRTTDPGNPVYVFDPSTQTAIDGVDGHGPVVLAVDFLPTELPLESSESFSRVLAPLVHPLAAADYSNGFESLALPPELKRAVITHRGELTPNYRYLEANLDRD